VIGVDRYINVTNLPHLMAVNINRTKLMLELARSSNTRFI
jgi:hypothetical protein